MVYHYYYASLQLRPIYHLEDSSVVWPSQENGSASSILPRRPSSHFPPTPDLHSPCPVLRKLGEVHRFARNIPHAILEWPSPNLLNANMAIRIRALTSVDPLPDLGLFLTQTHSIEVS